MKARSIAAIKADLGQVDLHRLLPRLAAPHTSEYRRSLQIRAQAHRRVLHSTRTSTPPTDVIDEVTIEPAPRKTIVAQDHSRHGRRGLGAVDRRPARRKPRRPAAQVRRLFLHRPRTHLADLLRTAPSARPRRISNASSARSMKTRPARRQGLGNWPCSNRVVTQASSAIPVVPLYISPSLQGDEGTGQPRGLHRANGPPLPRAPRRSTAQDDDQAASASTIGRWRRRSSNPSSPIWHKVTTDNLVQLADLAGYKAEFLRLFGFGLEGVDYDADVSPVAEFDVDNIE